MTPQQIEQFNKLVESVKKLTDRLDMLEEDMQVFTEWKKAREIQQLTNPVDAASINSLGAAVSVGPGSIAKIQSIVVGSTPATISVPAAYIGTEILLINGALREIPYIG